MSNQLVEYTNSQLLYNQKLINFLEENQYKWSNWFSNSEFIPFLLTLSKSRLTEKIFEVKVNKIVNFKTIVHNSVNQLTVESHVCGYYKSLLTESVDNIIYGKYFSINMRNNSDDLGSEACNNSVTNLLGHLDFLFKDYGYPEFIFLIDSVYHPRLLNEYLQKGYSSLFIASSVKKNLYSCGITILSKKVFDTTFLENIKIVPYSYGFTNTTSFKNKRINHVANHFALFVKNSFHNFVGAFHQPAYEIKEIRAFENILQISRMNNQNLKVEALLMDSNKYGIDNFSFNKNVNFARKLTGDHPAFFFTPSIVKKKFQNINLNFQELNEFSKFLNINFSNYRVLAPMQSGLLKKTFHGLQDSYAQKVFSDMMELCLDIAICNTDYFDWTIFDIPPVWNEEYYTDHSGILLISEPK
jgi:hypothetical protein